MRAKHAAHGADHEALMPLDQLLKGPVVPAAYQSHQPNIFGILRGAASWAGFVTGYGKCRQKRLGGEG